MTDAATASRDDHAEEWALKQTRLTDFLDRRGLDGVFLWHRNNFAWITCGGDNHIPDASDVGTAGILATRDRRLCVTSTIEAPWMRGEELAGQGIETIDYPWYDTDQSRKIVTDCLGELGLDPAKVAGDVDRLGLGLAALPADWSRLRWQLTPQEMERYREGATRAAGAVEQVAEAIEPDMSEQDVSAMLDHLLRAVGLVPRVNLVASDERISDYRRLMLTDKDVGKYVMLVSGSSHGGLISNLTRFVYFGRVPDDLAARQQAVADIDATVNLVARPGRKLGEVFADLQAAYAKAGFSGEWMHHHQGGSTGYAEREVLATPGDETEILDGQAFAWNPSIRGAKSGDTVLVTADALEVLTGHSDDWPTITGHSEIGDLPRAACLVRE